MLSTTTLVSFFLPHSLASTSSNHRSYSGKKWPHFAIFNVFWLARARSGKRKKGPTAADPAAILTKSRLEKFLPVLLAMGRPSAAYFGARVASPDAAHPRLLTPHEQGPDEKAPGLNTPQPRQAICLPGPGEAKSKSLAYGQAVDPLKSPVVCKQLKLLVKAGSSGAPFGLRT